MEKVYYMAIKQYSGFFKKTHTGNTLILMVPTKFKNLIFYVTGRQSVDEYILGLWREFGKSTTTDNLANQFKEHLGGSCVILDALDADVKSGANDSYTITS